MGSKVAEYWHFPDFPTRQTVWRQCRLSRLAGECYSDARRLGGVLVTRIDLAASHLHAAKVENQIAKIKVAKAFIDGVRVL